MLRTGSTEGFSLLEQLGHYGIPKDSTPYNFVGQASYPYHILATLLRPPRRVYSTGTLKKSHNTFLPYPFQFSVPVIHNYITYPEEKE